MPLVNVIRGERIDPAPFNVRPPILRIPLWMVLAWWLLKGVGVGLFLACRFWYLTAPAIGLLWLYLRFDWYGPAGLALAVVVLGGAWYLAHAASFLRFGWYPVLGRWRRLVYRRRWHPAMATAKLAVTFDGHTVLPVLRSVRCRPGRAARARRPPGRP